MRRIRLAPDRSARTGPVPGTGRGRPGQVPCVAAAVSRPDVANDARVSTGHVLVSDTKTGPVWTRTRACARLPRPRLQRNDLLGQVLVSDTGTCPDATTPASV